jgi:hypothetical protein
MRNNALKNIFIDMYDIKSDDSYFLHIKNETLRDIFTDMYDIKFNEVNKQNISPKKNKKIVTLKELFNNIHFNKNDTHSYLDSNENLLYSNKMK